MLRPFPYPFASALSIVSDVDASTRGRFKSYIRDMVLNLGLDFGDSIWLKTSSEAPALAFQHTNGLGFFSRHFGIGRSEAARAFHWTRTFLESLAEYHAGNLDHFHAYQMRGPRVAVLGRGERTSKGMLFQPERFEKEGFWRCQGIYIDAVCIAAHGELAIERVAITECDGRVTEFARQVDAPSSDEGIRQFVFVMRDLAEDDVPIPRLDDISRVEVEYDAQDGDPDVAQVLLISGSTYVVLNRLRLLRDKFNVESPLVTEHAGYHFRSAVMSERRDARQHEYLATHADMVAALNGTNTAAENTPFFSTDADDPRSLACMLPTISTELEVRFLVPEAATSSTGWQIEKMVQPLETRQGTIVYQVHRTLPNLKEPAGRARFDGTQSSQENFTQRLGKVLDATKGTPGLYWPIYTHLGGIMTPTADHALPDPYFEGDELNRLQDRVYNITGTVCPEERIWMTRASTMYDHALIMRSAMRHVAWTDADTVDIESWRDPVLNKSLPRSPAQLYGLTFYVDNPARARIFLDGKPLRLFSRNDRDETKRFSVTIWEAEICHPVFAALDPLRNAGVEARLVGGDWSFTPAENDTPAFGRLTVSGGEHASLQIPMHGWCAAGCQILSLLGGRGAGGSMGLVLETVSSGRFFFGDRALLDIVGPVTAHYVFEHDQGPGLRDLVAPLHCLTWAAASTTGGPLPSHALASITLHCAGERGAYADFGDLALRRPRVTSLNHGSAPTYCLGGIVPEFKDGQIVQAQDESGTISTTVDQRGWFCFPELSEGIYQVWAEGETGKVYDRRGPLVELKGDMMSLELSRTGFGETSA